MVKRDSVTQNYLYLQCDYQGSILAISDATGQVLEKRLFDAWGNVLVQDAAGNLLNGLTILDRGYTGHEHLTSVGLINMNARLYDPKLHRFLQPDNYVQDPTNTQSYNRYGYCWNNPFKYTDESGEWIHILLGAIIGGVVNWATHGCQFNMEGLKAFGIGAGAGLIGAATGGAAFLAVKWYATATGTTTLNKTTALVNGTTYFATQSIDGCESTNRLQITADVIKIPAPTGDGIQQFCLEGNPVISNLIATGNPIVWFDALTNGMMLDNTTLLHDNTTYFATTLDAATGCESIQRLAVKVDLFKCNITAYNLITINGNSLNDQLTFEDISYFPDNSVKIYNRYGKLVWETTGYDNTTNAFKGKANVASLLSNENLPDGTYFYILTYHNPINSEKIEKNGYLQIINSN